MVLRSAVLSLARPLAATFTRITSHNTSLSTQRFFSQRSLSQRSLSQKLLFPRPFSQRLYRSIPPTCTKCKPPLPTIDWDSLDGQYVFISELLKRFPSETFTPNLVEKSSKKMRRAKLVPRESTYQGLLGKIAFSILPKGFQARDDIGAGKKWADYGILESGSGDVKLLAEIMVEDSRYADHLSRAIKYGIHHKTIVWLMNFFFSKPREITNRVPTPGVEEITIFVDQENYEVVVLRGDIKPTVFKME